MPVPDDKEAIRCGWAMPPGGLRVVLVAKRAAAGLGRADAFSPLRTAGSPEAVAWHARRASLMHREPSRTLPVGEVCSKPTLERGEPTTISCVEIFGQTYALANGPIRIIRLEDEWYEDVADPTAVVSALRER